MADMIALSHQGPRRLGHLMDTGHVMEIATQDNILELLPSELISEILAILDSRDLVSCMQVRHSISFLLLEFGRRSSIRVPLTARHAGRCASAFSI
jgi:hypothetical protein